MTVEVVGTAVCEVLAGVPVRLGHELATGDVVAVGVCGADDREPRLVARTDLGVLCGDSGAAVARSIAAHLVALGCARVLAVCALPGDRGEVPTLPVLRDACAAAGLCWDGVWAQGPDWLRHRPLGWRLPRSMLAGTEAADRARALGLAPVARRSDLGVIPVAGSADRRAAAEGRLRWVQRRPCPDPGEPGPVWGDWQRTSLRRWCAALDRPGEVRRAGLGRIEAGFGDPVVVEAGALAVLGDGPGAQGPGGGHEEWERVLVARLGAPRLAVPLGAPVGTGAGADPDPVTVGLRPWLALLLAPATVGPDPERTRAAIRLLVRVLGHGRRTGQSGALALLALFCWWQGEGVRAAVLVDRALADRPVDPLAAQLDWLLSAGALPGWARSAGAPPAPSRSGGGAGTGEGVGVA